MWPMPYLLDFDSHALLKKKLFFYLYMAVKPL